MPQADPSRELARLEAMARSAGVPVYQLLGGPTRTKVRVLTPLKTASPDELKKMWDAGARAFAVPLPARGPARRFVSDVVARMESLRRAAGDGSDFVLICNAALTPAQAGQVARALESFHLLWLDEPCPLQYFDALKKIADETVTPLGFGGSLAEMQQLLASNVAGILRPDIDRLGVSNVRKIAALAESYYVAVAPKASSDALAIQVAASLANFFIHESAALPLQDGYLAVRP
jgi:galactonate dehydratase